MLLGVGYSQCDANGDGDLDVLDVVIEVDCILTDCWEGGSDTTVVCEDIDGNVYETIQIGEQLWMAENLKTTHYKNGYPIATGYSDGDWEILEQGAYAVYGDSDVYGNLYNWYTVDDERGICPDSWHVPSDEEFMELEMYLGMSEEEANSVCCWTEGNRGTNEGSKLAGNSDLWFSIYGEEETLIESDPEFGTSGFNGLPAGYRNNYTGSFPHYLGSGAAFWSSSEYNSSNGYNSLYRRLGWSYSSVDRLYGFKQYGFSIRCLKD